MPAHLYAQLSSRFPARDRVAVETQEAGQVELLDDQS